MKQISLESWVMELRRNLEDVWCPETRYHGTVVVPSDHLSKGQCGASSLVLAKALVNHGYDAYFCEGDAIFPPEKGKNVSINNHCWVMIKNYYRNNGSFSDAIIDLTADQEGHSEKVLFRSKNELKKLHIDYNESASGGHKKPNQVYAKHVLERADILQDGLNKKELII